MDAPVPQASGNCARTVKSCGPDLPTLGSTPGAQAPGGRRL